MIEEPPIAEMAREYRSAVGGFANVAQTPGEEDRRDGLFRRESQGARLVGISYRVPNAQTGRVNPNSLVDRTAQYPAVPRTRPGRGAAFHLPTIEGRGRFPP